MKRSVPALALLVLAISACKPAADPQAGTTPSEPIPPVASVAAVEDTPPVAQGMAGFAGYGDMKLGSSEEDTRSAWAGELKGEPAETGGCHYLSPKWVKTPSDFAFMIEGGRFVRYDVGTDKEVAPGGGKVGMTVAELQALYHDALQSTPHKYVTDGQYLSITASGVAPGKLVFETDATGRVSRWRVGLPPQVDYVEGCS